MISDVYGNLYRRKYKFREKSQSINIFMPIKGAYRRRNDQFLNSMNRQQRYIIPVINFAAE